MNNIIGPLAHLAVSIGDLTPDPDNARIHTDRNLDAIAASLRAYGQRKPVVVQAAGMIIRAGNGTVEAARRLGWTEVAAVVVEEGGHQAAAYGLADNRTAELASWDEPTLARVLSAISTEDGFDPLALGWEEREVVKLLADYGGFHDVDVEAVFDEQEDAAAEEPTKSGAHQPGASETSHPATADTRMVQLFYTEQQHAQFVDAVRRLASVYGDTDVGAVVLRALTAHA